jgi:hypothetical protein
MISVICLSFFLEAFIKNIGNASNLKSFYQAECQSEKKRFSTTKETGPGSKIFTLSRNWALQWSVALLFVFLSGYILTNGWEQREFL